MRSFRSRRFIPLAVLVLTLVFAGAPAASSEELQAAAAVLLPSDTDGDGLSNTFEEGLIKKFFPNLWVSTLQDRAAFYGCITSDPYAKVPYMLEPVWYQADSPLAGLACLYPDECLLLKIGLAYDSDYGDDFFGGGHPGDSEFYYALLSRVSFNRAITKKNASGLTCTASLAKTDPNCWWLMVDWTSAHSGELTDSSYHAVISPFLDTVGDSNAPVVYAATGKHANYHRDSECDGSNSPLAVDDCDPSYNVRDTCFLRFQNIGRSITWGGNGMGDGYPREIRYPLSSTQRYDMWSDAKFADSSPYKPQFARNGTTLWELWYNCVFAGSATAKAVYCGRFDVQCESDESCTCYDSCSPNQSLLACGNGVCSPGETCSSCSQDCGTCPPVCGNGRCESGESCSSCRGDCSPCPTCGNGICESGETCQTSGGAGQCQSDCGCCTGWQPICFVGGTPVALADGSTQPIEQVQKGDQVLAYDELTGKVVPARVSKTFIHTDVHKSLVAINGWLLATANHPFYVKGRTEPVRADELRLGDELLVLDEGPGKTEPGLRPVKVASLEQLPPAKTVYNIEVEGTHNFFAGGVLVHNKTSTAGCEPSSGGGGVPID